MKTNSLAAKAAQIQQSAGNAANLPAKTEQKKVLAPSVAVGNMLAKYKSDISQALPAVMTPERFTRIATTTICNSPKLIQAVTDAPRTLISSLMTAAQLGLEPNTPLGQCYLIPRLNKNKVTGRKEMQVSFQLGYQGVIDLCYRSNEVSLIYAQTIYSKDDYTYELGLDPKLEHKPYRGADRGDPIAYYAVFKTKSGGTGFAFMYREEVLAHAKQYSMSYDEESGAFYGPWQTDFDAMAKKTVLIQALKYAPKKSDFARMIFTDSTTKSNFGADMTAIKPDDYIDAEEIPTDKPSNPASPDGRAALDQTPANTVPPDTANQMSPDGELNLGDVK